MKNKTWFWLIFLVLFIAFAIWFFTSGNDSATGFRWFAAKGGW